MDIMDVKSLTLDIDIDGEGEDEGSTFDEGMSSEDYSGIGDDEEILLQFDEDLHSLDNTGDKEWRMGDVVDGFRMIANNQWTDDSLYGLAAEGRTPITINEMHPYINGILGLVMQNKREVKAYPVERNDTDYSEAVTRLVRWARDVSKAETVEMRALYHTLITGIGCTYEYIDYTNDVDGMIKKKVVSPRNIAWDQAAVETNLTDANWVCFLEFLTKREIYTRYPEHAKEILEQTKQPKDPFDYLGLNQSTAIYSYQSRLAAMNFDNEVNNGKYPIYHYQYKRNKTVWLIENPLANEDYAQYFQDFPLPMSPEMMQQPMPMGGIPPEGMPPEMQGLMQPQSIPNPNTQMYRDLISMLGLSETQDEWEVDEEQRRMIMETAMATGVPLKMASRKKVQCYQAVIASSKILQKSECRTDRFDFNFITGIYDESRKNWYLMTRLLKDPQRTKNAVFLKIYEAMNASPKGGVLVEESAVANPQKFDAEYISPRSNAYVKEGMIDRIRPKFESSGAAAYESILQYLSGTFAQVTGVNKEMFGSTDQSAASGVALQEFTRQGMAAIAPIFHAYSEYLRNSGYLYISFLRILSENKEGREIRVLNDKTLAAEFIEISKDKFSSTYDIEIMDAPMSPSQKAQTFEQLTNLLSSGMLQPDQQAVVATAAMEYANISSEIRQKLTAAEEEQKQKQQLTPEQQQMLDQAQQMMEQAQQVTSQTAQETTAEQLKNMRLQNEQLEINNHKQARDIGKQELEIEKQALELEKLKSEIMQIQATVAEKSANSDLKQAQTLESLAKTGQTVPTPMHEQFVSQPE